MPFPHLPPLFRRLKLWRRPSAPAPTPVHAAEGSEQAVRRHFYNERGFQTYGSFFRCWDGWITAGHVLDAAGGRRPPFATGHTETWPGALDAGLIGCSLPKSPPATPYAGQDLICTGYPAGARAPETRRAKCYIERPGQPHQWIGHILMPDEPVVTGMSGGLVADAQTGAAVGIIITRNSPADLNNDRDPDESLDFISLFGVWEALLAEKVLVS